MRKTNREKLSDVLWIAGIFDHEYGDKIIELFDEERRIAKEEERERLENEIGGFIAGVYALRFDENSREVECWDMWKAGYEQCRKDALNGIKYENRRQN